MSRNTECIGGDYHSMKIIQPIAEQPPDRYQSVLVRCVTCGAVAEVCIYAEDLNWQDCLSAFNERPAEGIN